MLVVTSCNAAQWDRMGGRWLPSYSQPGVELLVYHEDSFTGAPSSPRPAGPEYRDLFLDDPRLAEAVSRPQYAEARLEPGKARRIMRGQACYWLRKVAANVQASLRGVGWCWTDIDTVANPGFLGSLDAMDPEADILYVDRMATRYKVTDTGFIVFRCRQAVRDFTAEWYAEYLDGRVFEREYWADHYMFDATLAKFPDLKLGVLPECRSGLSAVRHCLGHRRNQKLREGRA